MAFRHTRAGEIGDLGAHLPINGGRFARARFIKQRRVETFLKVTPFDIKDGRAAELQGLGDLIRVMTTVQQIEHAGAGLGASQSSSATENSFQRTEVVG
jgi:hypothetical protein